MSQAAPLRRVAVTGGNVSLMDYCTAGPQFAIGRFIADSTFSGGTVINGVRFHDLLTVSLNRAGTIDHVINDTGDPVTPTHAGPSTVVSYP